MSPPPTDAPVSPCLPAPPDLGVSTWFRQEVHPHDAQLKAYLRGSFPAVRDVEDVVQESYLRIWKAKALHPIDSAKAFLFQVARHLALDHVRRNKINPVDQRDDLQDLHVAQTAPSVLEQLSEQEKFRFLTEAIAELPPRCRAVILLCKVRGYTHRQTAAELQISEKTVNEQVLRGVKRLGEILRARGLDSQF